MEGPFATILCTELVGSLALFERHGDEVAERLRREALSAQRRAIADHGGRELSSAGEGLTAAFPSAATAVLCAVQMQRSAAAQPSGPGLRIGLHAGEVVADGDDLSGLPVIVAGHLRDAAADGDVLASDVVRQVAGPRVAALMRPAGAVRVGGGSEPIAVAEVRWRDQDAAEAPPHGSAPSARPITVVIADDQRLLRTGFRVILEAEPDVTVVGEAGDGRSAVDVVTRRRPNVVLMDIRMPELDGLQAAERILARPDSTTAVVMLTTFDASDYVYEALRIGASGFLLKDAPTDRLLDAVRVAAAGEALIAPSITRRLIEQFTRGARPEPGGVPPALAELTARELDVLRLIARGLSNAEIAAELILGESTIKTHVARVLSKLSLRDRVQAVVLAYETGLVARELSPLNPDSSA